MINSFNGYENSTPQSAPATGPSAGGTFGGPMNFGAGAQTITQSSPAYWNDPASQQITLNTANNQYTQSQQAAQAQSTEAATASAAETSALNAIASQPTNSFSYTTPAAPTPPSSSTSYTYNITPPSAQTPTTAAPTQTSATPVSGVYAGNGLTAAQQAAADNSTQAAANTAAQQSAATKASELAAGQAAENNFLNSSGYNGTPTNTLNSSGQGFVSAGPSALNYADPSGNLKPVTNASINSSPISSFMNQYGLL